MNRNSVRKFWAPFAFALNAGVALVTAPSAFAQAGAAPAGSPGTAPTDDQTVKLGQFTVTGSYIPAAADEAKALPVQVLNVNAIQESGVATNVLDVLRKTIPQIQGGNNIGTENANIAGASSNGGSQVSLRNIDTLVLIDGKRVAASAVAASGEAGTGGEFVDLNLIPLSAIERIEVLTDGASAIYGTDAVSGVINIILKKDFDGVEVDMHYDAAPKDTGGYWRSRAISALAGAGNDKTHLMFAAEWTKSQPLWERDTAYDNPYFGTPTYPGIINDASGNFYQLKAGLAAPPTGTPTTFANLVAQGIYNPVANPTLGFNLSTKPTVLNRVDKRIADVSGYHLLNSWLTLKGDFLYAYTDTNYQLNPQPVSTSTANVVGLPSTPITDTNLTVRNRFIFGPNRIYDNQSNFYRATAELVGKVNDYFNFDVYANYNVAYQDALGYNQILNSALQTAIRNGNINMFALQQDPNNLAKAGIYGTSIGNYTSQLYTYDAIVNGKVWDLPTGTINYAVGVEYRKEALKAIADYNSTIPPGGTTSLWNNGVSLAPFNNQRHVESEFAELKVPLTQPSNGIPGFHLLSIDGAVRHERYSDGNHTSVPKVSIRWLPLNDDIAIRATYARSFSAPTLYDLYGPSTSGVTTSLGGLQKYPAGSGKFANLQANQLNGFNPNLTPSKATSKTAGVVLSPHQIKGLEITIDYYKIKQTDLIGAPGSSLTMLQSVENLGAASPFAKFVTQGNFAGFAGATPFTAPGQVSANLLNTYVLETLVNIATQEQHGWDINVHYTLPWTDYGRFVIGSEWALLNQFFVSTGPNDPGTDYAGFNDNGTLPKARSYSTLDWDYKYVGATLAWNNIHHVDNLSGDYISAYNTFDAQVRFDIGKYMNRFKGISVDVGCNNFTNVKPPLDRTNFASPPFDASAYSFFGRMYYADLRIKF